jgi:hypothetical protein
MDASSVLKEWHIISAIGLIVVSIFKSDIKLMIDAFITRYEQSHFVGRTIQIQSGSGEWEGRFVERYCLPMPFIRGGGIILSHMVDDVSYKETISFPNWAQLRIRLAQS